MLVSPMVKRMCFLDTWSSTPLSSSPSSFNSSFRLLPGTTNRMVWGALAGSRRRASRKPSTLTTVRQLSPISNREPVCMGRTSSVETAKEVSLIIERRVFCWICTENSSSTSGSSG